jgi:integrase
MNLVPLKANALVPAKAHIEYLSEHQLNSLTAAFQKFFDDSPSPRQYVKRGRHWLIFLVLRYTGARLGEVLQLNADTDIDYRNCELKLVTLKQHTPKGKYGKKRAPSRIIPVPANVIAEISNYRLQVAQYAAKGEVTDKDVNPFKIDPATFRKTFYRLAEQAGIPRDLGHPHILRHGRSVELLRAGVPVTIVQDLLGHSSLNTTAIYLRIAGQEAKQILKDRGMI